MKTLKYDEFSKLPEGVIYSYYFPPVDARNSKALKRTLMGHTEGLYVKGETFNDDPVKYNNTDYNFTERSLLPNILEAYKDLEDDPNPELSGMWKEDSGRVDDIEGWAYELEPHYYIVYEGYELNNLSESISRAQKVTMENI